MDPEAAAVLTKPILGKPVAFNCGLLQKEVLGYFAMYWPAISGHLAFQVILIYPLYTRLESQWRVILGYFVSILCYFKI